jgi:hypothetical protein
MSAATESGAGLGHKPAPGLLCAAEAERDAMYLARQSTLGEAR